MKKIYFFRFASLALTIARACSAVRVRLDFLPPRTWAGLLKTNLQFGHFILLAAVVDSAFPDALKAASTNIAINWKRMTMAILLAPANVLVRHIMQTNNIRPYRLNSITSWADCLRSLKSFFHNPLLSLLHRMRLELISLKTRIADPSILNLASSLEAHRYCSQWSDGKLSKHACRFYRLPERYTSQELRQPVLMFSLFPFFISLEGLYKHN